MHPWIQPRIQPEPDPFVWEHFLPKPGAFLVLQAHLSLFIRFFAEPGKNTHVTHHKNIHEASPPQKRRTPPSHCPTQTDSLSQLRKLKPTGRNLFSFFQSERDSSAFRAQRSSGLPEPRLQKATSKHKKKKSKNKRTEIPPPLPAPKAERRARSREGKGDEAHGEGGRVLPFSASLLFLLSVVTLELALFICSRIRAFKDTVLLCRPSRDSLSSLG